MRNLIFQFFNYRKIAILIVFFLSLILIWPVFSFAQTGNWFYDWRLPYATPPYGTAGPFNSESECQEDAAEGAFISQFSVTKPCYTTSPAVTFSSSPTNIASGYSSTLSWSSTNITSCAASGAWTGTKTTSGTQTVTPTTTSTYTLTCTGVGGTVVKSTTVSVTPAPEITASHSEVTQFSAKITVTVEEADPSLLPFDLKVTYSAFGGDQEEKTLNTTGKNTVPYTVSAILDGLEPGKVYSYRIFDVKTNTLYTKSDSFQTESLNAPKISMYYSNVSYTSADVTVSIDQVDPALLPLDLGLAWGEIGVKVDRKSLNTTGLKASDIPYTIKEKLSLEPGRTYSFNVFKVGTTATYGEPKSFTTPVLAPDDFVMEYSDVTDKSAKISIHHLSKDFQKDFINKSISLALINRTLNKEILLEPGEQWIPVVDSKASHTFEKLDAGTSYQVKAVATGVREKSVYFSTLETPPTTTTTTTTLIPTTTREGGAGIVPKCGYVTDKDLTKDGRTYKTNDFVPCTFNDLMRLINSFINFLLFKLGLPLAAGLLAYAGILFLFSGAKENLREKGKKIAWNVVLGLTVALAAWLIIKTILVGLGLCEGYHLLENFTGRDCPDGG